MSTVLPPGDPRHGSNGYSNLMCRCDVCRAANTEWQTKRRGERRALLAADPGRVEHGTTGTYTNWWCRCRPCRAAHSATRASWVAAKNARASQVTP